MDVKNIGYSEYIKTFLSKTDEEIHAKILEQDTTSQLHLSQKKSWATEIKIMKNALTNLRNKMKNTEDKSIIDNGRIIFEYSIPRLKGRIDVVVIIGHIIFTIEFKVNAPHYLLSYRQQANGYAIDLKNSHDKSQGCKIVPVLICTNASQGWVNNLHINPENKYLYDLIEDNGKNLCQIIESVLNQESSFKIPQVEDWEYGRYDPTPGIIEQAVKVFSSHTVKNITNTESQEKLKSTSDRVNQIINETKQREENRKSIIFVTGVPGAGKTLVGLNVVNERQKNQDKAVFLSGNGPLVAVLREALAQDRGGNKTNSIKKVREQVKYMIQMIHQYRDEFFKILKFNDDGGIEVDGTKRSKHKTDGFADVEHVVIFDEAQRAWDHKELNDFYHKKYDNKNIIPFSEPGFLIWSMNLKKDWATIVCLVGEGQEIFTGEAGIAEWILQARENFKDWNLYMSDKIVTQLGKSNDLKLKNIMNNPKENNIIIDPQLHLGTSQRSLRSGKVADFVEAVLACDTKTAKNLYQVIKTKYPIYITRDIEKAKEWCWKNIVNHDGRIEDRCGVLASSRAGRTKAIGYEVKNFKTLGAIKTAAWFLNLAEDPRSSIRMEEALSEFIVQGLEIDYTTVIWDADYRYNQVSNEWDKYYTRGMKWNNNNEEINRKYHENAYRVLLTRSRKGLVIVVPEGETRQDSLQDPTRLPEFYDPTYNYLHNHIGIAELP